MMTPLFPALGDQDSDVSAVADADMSEVTPQLWMRGQGGGGKIIPSINADQLTSISALIAYISAQSGQSEFRVERNLSDKFNIANAKCLPAEQYDNAMRYLVDVLPQ